MWLNIYLFTLPPFQVNEGSIVKKNIYICLNAKMCIALRLDLFSLYFQATGGFSNELRSAPMHMQAYQVFNQLFLL